MAGGCHVAGCELWRTDGTSLGTELVEDINPGGFSDPEQLTDVNGTLLFTADDGSHGRELWSSDGTPAGTSLVADLEPTGSSELLELTGLGSTLLFTYDDGVHGRELWRYVP